MIKNFIFFFLLTIPFILTAQKKQKEDSSSPQKEIFTPSKREEISNTPNKQETTLKARNDQYEIYTIEKDTTYVDTSLTIHSEYKYNYLRRDNFGLLLFANEGQTANIIDFGLYKFSPYPGMGFKAKQINYLKTNEIKYYSVATPLTELFFRTVMEQGQNVDAMISVNTSKQFNFSISYRGIRSLGKYINQLSSIGNLTITSSYYTKNKRYIANFHYTGQDLLNGENGGITTIADFEGDDANFRNRARLQVYFTDAKTFLKGKRAFIDHSFRINRKEKENNLLLNHRFSYEARFFEFYQENLITKIIRDGSNIEIQRFGESFITGTINDQVKNNNMFNHVGLSFRNKYLGKVKVFIEDYFYNQYYAGDRNLTSGQVIPGALKTRINSIGGQYFYESKKIKGDVILNQSFSNQTFSELTANLSYTHDDKNSIEVQFQNLSKIPDNNFILHQSSYVNYNWSNSFKNEKINNLTVDAKTQWLNASFKFVLLNDHLYFSDDTANDTLIVTPKQYGKAINYLSLKLNREFKYKKWALDNTILYQNVTQDDPILNLPQFTTRNTVYFSDYYFKKALYLQTGIIFNYFTEFYANDLNPVLGETFVQNQRKIGNFPTFDFFVNARIRQTRIFLKAEHFNSGFTGNNFYSAPNYPYRDFTVRFGLVWNFFQ